MFEAWGADGPFDGMTGAGLLMGVVVGLGC